MTRPVRTLTVMHLFRRDSQFWPSACVAVLMAAAVAPHALLRGPADWELVYVPAAERFERGDDLLRDAYVYPPFQALLAVPSAHLGPTGVRVWVWLTNTAGATALVLCGWRLTGGRLSFRSPPREWLIALLGLPAFLGFVFEVTANRQTDLVLGGLAVGGCLLIARRRDLIGGACVGLAAAAKCTPLLFVPYLFWVGRWRAAVAVLAVAVGANFLPDLLVHPPGGRPRVVDWAERYLLPIGNKDYKAGQWAAGEWSNHSLVGVVGRLTTSRLVSAVPEYQIEPRPDPPSPTLLKGVVHGFGLGLIALTAWVVRRGGRRVEACGVGAVFCLMLLLSPMSSKPHFCVLAVPAWAVVRAGVEGRRWWLLAPAVLAGLVELPAAKDLVGGRANALAMWYGVVPLGVLLLFAGCLWARWTAPPPTEESP